MTDDASVHIEDAGRSLDRARGAARQMVKMAEKPAPEGGLDEDRAERLAQQFLGNVKSANDHQATAARLREEQG